MITLQFIIMALGFMLLGALIHHFCCDCGSCGCGNCACDDSDGCEDCNEGADVKKCPTCDTCAAGTCALQKDCPKKCDCGAKAKPLAAAASGLAVAAASMKKDDDLVIIEGIGPAIKKVLNSHGVHTFADVASTPREKIHEWLNAAGPQFRMHDASTWKEQAELARDGKMAELEALKIKLNNGQHV